MLEKNQNLQGRYQIIRPLGHGGMGTVYEAKDRKLFGKLVALKEILLDKNLNPQQKEYKAVRRAFEREAKILTQLEHEAFPQVIDYFVENDRQFLVMELIQGKDLGELLKKRRTPFELEEVLPWANQLLDALDYLHRLNPPTIHRDIKPQNLKLNPRKRIKLLDFGIAKGADLPANITLTNQTFIAATFNYSPIEQIFRVLDPSFIDALKPFYSKQLEEIAKQTAAAGSDLYSLGATLYHLLTKQLPFDSLKRTLEIWAGSPDPLISPQTINSNIPTKVSDWLLKAMQVNREKRFETAAAMKNALLVAIDDDKIQVESTHKLNLKKELELLRLEREALEKARRKFEEERKNYEKLNRFFTGDALAVPDFPQIKAEFNGEVENYKTNTSIQPDLFDHPSVLTIKSEQSPNEALAEETWTDFTATSYLINLDVEPEKQIPETLKKEVRQTVLPTPIKGNPVRYYPIVLVCLFLLGGTVLFGFVLNNTLNQKETPNFSSESVISNQNAVSVTPETTPETVFAKTPKPERETFEKIAVKATPKLSPSPSKKKQYIQTTSQPERFPVQSPTPKPAKTATSKPTKTPTKPRSNPDCIFNNDCR